MKILGLKLYPVENTKISEKPKNIFALSQICLSIKNLYKKFQLANVTAQINPL